MTGLTLETLAAGSRPEWEARIYIDPGVLEKMSNWLCDQQNNVTGGFVRQSYFFDLKMVVSTRRELFTTAAAVKRTYNIIKFMYKFEIEKLLQ